MFDFLKKKQLHSDAEQSSTELVALETQETAICEVETKMIAKITPTELMEYMSCFDQLCTNKCNGNEILNFSEIKWHGK